MKCKTCRRAMTLAMCYGAVELYKCPNGHSQTNADINPAAKATMDALREQKAKERKR